MTDCSFAGRASRETIAEWWEYTCRRGWIEEQAAGRWWVSRLGREELHEQRRRASQPDPLVGAKAVTKWVLAVGVVGAAGLLSNKHLTTELAILAICATIVVALLIGGLLTRFLDPPVDRWMARCACDWLEGRRVDWRVWTVSAANGKVARLYEESGRQRAKVRQSPVLCPLSFDNQRVWIPTSAEELEAGFGEHRLIPLANGCQGFGRRS